MAPTEESSRISKRSLAMNRQSPYSSGTFTSNYTTSASTSTNSIPLPPVNTSPRKMKKHYNSTPTSAPSPQARQQRPQLDSLRWQEHPLQYQMPTTTSDRKEEDCAMELQMKTIQMLALIRGTTTEAVIESEMEEAYKRIINEQSAVNASQDIDNEEVPDDEDPDYLIGESFEDQCTLPTGRNLSSAASTQHHSNNDTYRKSPDLDEIFELEL